MTSNMTSNIEFMHKLLAAPDWETARQEIGKELIRQLENEHMELTIRMSMQGEDSDTQVHKTWLEEQVQVAKQVIKTKQVPTNNQNQPPLETKVIELERGAMPPFFFG